MTTVAYAAYDAYCAFSLRPASVHMEASHRRRPCNSSLRDQSAAYAAVPPYGSNVLRLYSQTARNYRVCRRVRVELPRDVRSVCCVLSPRQRGCSASAYGRSGASSTMALFPSRTFEGRRGSVIRRSATSQPAPPAGIEGQCGGPQDRSAVDRVMDATNDYSISYYTEAVYYRLWVD